MKILGFEITAVRLLAADPSTWSKSLCRRVARRIDRRHRGGYYSYISRILSIRKIARDYGTFAGKFSLSDAKAWVDHVYSDEGKGKAIN